MNNLLIAEIDGGYSLLPEDEYMIGYIYEDGSVNWNKLNVMLQRCANAGAGFVREWGYWPTGNGHFEAILTPFRNYGTGRSFTWNDDFFSNWNKIFTFMYHQYNLIPHFVLFNASETRVGGPKHHWAKENSPWRSFDDYFYGEDAKGTREKWIDKIIECAADVPVWFEICNEPKAPGAANMILHSIQYLVEKHDFPLGRIITGWDIFRKEREPVYAESYRTFRQKFVEWYRDTVLEGDFNPERSTEYIEEQIVKATIWSTMHGCTEKTINEYFGPSETAKDLVLRNQIYSTDGAKNEKGKRLTWQDGYNLAVELWRGKENAIKKGKVIPSILIGKEAEYKDPYAALRGFCDGYAVKVHLQNRRKFPDPLPLPSWATPQPEEPNQPPSVPPSEPGPIPDSIFVPPRPKNKTWFQKHWRWVVGIASGLLAAGLIIFASWPLGIFGAAQLYALRHFEIIK